ncbi:MAG: type II secretion system F family protein [Phycicoccus sp.]|nr:type II secretion system F family protein [Phycicoccus sp.]
MDVLTQLHLAPAQVAALSQLLATVDPELSDKPPAVGEGRPEAADSRTGSRALGDGGQSGVAAPELAFVLAAAALSARSGAPLSAALRLAAEVTRAEESARERQAVLMAGPRASMMLLTLLPLAGPLLAWSLGWDPFAQSAAIYVLIGLGGVLTLLGWLWSRRLVRGAGRVTCLAPDPTRASTPATVLDVARAVDLMPLALLTGCGSTEAIELVAQVVSGRVAADLNVAVAARRWHTEPGREWQLAGPAWSSVGIAWRTADRAGAAPAGLLTATAARIRRTEAAQIEARIQRAGVLLVLPLGLCFLPGFLLTTVVPVVADLVTRVL